MLKLHKPEINELHFRQKLLSDTNTMSYNNKWGGIISFPQEKWNDWYYCWVENNDSKRFYRYLQNLESNEFVGEIAYHYDNDRNIFICNIIVYAEYRRNGYGTEGLQLLCKAAKENGITELYDDISSDNPAVKLFLNNGFFIDHRTDEIIMVKKIL